MDDVTLLALAGCDEEAALLMLSDCEEKRMTPLFTLESFSDEDCLMQFRFHKEDIGRLQQALQVPDRIKCVQGTVVSGIEALCAVLRRLAYPDCLHDICSTFGRSTSAMSMILNTTFDILYDAHAGKLSNLGQGWIEPAEFAAAVHAKGAPLQNIWGFIDGTVRPICKPTYNQRVLYNGHKRTHAIKFQSVVTPNGLIADLYGPYEGRRHDCALLEASGIIERMSRGKYFGYALYADPAYPLRDNLIVPLTGANITPNQEDFNKPMSMVREAVEWGFKDIIFQFAFLDCKKNLKLYLQPVAKYYIVGAILVNCRTCLYGNRTSKHFNLAPPRLEQYLGLQN